MIRQMFCHKCGAEAGPEVQFCTACGASLAAHDPATDSATLVPWAPPLTVRVEAGRWIGEGWSMVTADLGNYVLMALVYVLLNGAGAGILQGPLSAGFHIFTMKKLLGRRADFGDLFIGFNYFVPSLIATLLIGLFVLAGTLLCIIPGLVIASMYKFTYLFIVDKRMDFWQAMQASHAVVKRDYFGFTMFLILMFLVNLLGLLCCVVGLLVTIPATFAAITIAYKEIVGFDPGTASTL
jgi:hypothetical protein